MMKPLGKFEEADVNRNGLVTIDDLSIIAQVLNGSLSHF